MPETVELRLADAISTQLAGASLSQTLYAYPVDLYLTGELGAGKTLFVQSLAKKLGISELVSSPTYALEQRYRTPSGLPFIHLDLYRLENRHLPEILAASADHQGIRCIEWANRISEEDRSVGPHIDVHLEETATGRLLHCGFDDIFLPTRSQIEEWRSTVMLPEHIARHCDAVADFAIRLGVALIDRSHIVRLEALRRSAEVHDLLRFIDFRPGAGPADAKTSPAEEDIHKQFRDRFTGLKHEPACAQFLIEEGFPELAEIVRVHGLTLPSPERTTIEQKLLFYADKRMMIDQIVSLDERFEDFRKRYGSSSESERSKIWYEEARKVERELFPEGVPL